MKTKEELRKRMSEISNQLKTEKDKYTYFELEAEYMELEHEYNNFGDEFADMKVDCSNWESIKKEDFRGFFANGSHLHITDGLDSVEFMEHLCKIINFASNDIANITLSGIIRVLIQKFYNDEKIRIFTDDGQLIIEDIKSD